MTNANMMKKAKLLLIEDEEAIRDMVRFSFPTAEFSLFDAENTSQAEQILANQIPQVIILDWMLPDKSGIDFIKWLRQEELFKHIPIIMLTAKAEEENKIKALMTGADDYVTKPFSPAELIARVRAVLRRGPLISMGGKIKIDNLVLDVNQCHAHINNHLLALTPIEYNMLHFFVKHPNKSFSRDQLITHVWGGNVYIDDRTVDVHIRRLRDKLRQYDYHDRIKTIRGKGYLFSGNKNELK